VVTAVKIRLVWLPVEVTAAEAILRKADGLAVLSVAGPFPNRGSGREVRLYLLTLLSPTGDSRALAASDADRRPRS
jgi:hypothetical protein